jgi:hypothetical protein
MAYCTLLAAQYSLRHTFTLFLRTVCRTKSVELTVCALERSPGEDAFLISEPKIGDDVLDTLARLSCVPIATDVSAAALPDDPRDLALPEDAADIKHPFGEALLPWFEEVTVRLYGGSYLRKETLGGGATGKAAVYQRLGDRGSDLVVIKKVNDEAQLDETQALANEHQILTTFQEHLGDLKDKRLLERVIPQVKPAPPGLTWDGRHLIMTPVCDRLLLDASNYVYIVVDLVTALRLAASANYVHRDVRPANIMVSQEPCVCNERQPKYHYHAVLIDWAFAIKAAAGPVAYQGTVSCASQNVLDQLSRGQSRVSLSFADDAESLVKALLRLSQPVGCIENAPNVQDNARRWANYWNSKSADSVSVANAMKAAQALVQPTAGNFQVLQDAITMMLKHRLEYAF